MTSAGPSGSWLNLVEVWNDQCHPFIWTKTADHILKKVNRQQT